MTVIDRVSSVDDVRLQMHTETIPATHAYVVQVQKAVKKVLNSDVSLVAAPLPPPEMHAQTDDKRLALMCHVVHASS